MLKKSIVVALMAMLSFVAFGVQAKDITIEGQNNLRFSKEKLTVAPGEKVTLKLVNKSNLPAAAMAHNWILLTQNANADKIDQAAASQKSNGYVPQSMSKQIIAHTGLVAGGDSDTVTFTAPKQPGDYEYICTFPGHYAAGMKGILTVKSGS